MGSIKEEWLRWFDERMHDRSIFLLMDNFFAHTVGLFTINAIIKLQHTTVQWLPPNSTSLHQPLDQGIIQNWKCYYQKSWFSYMIKELDQN